MRFRSLICHQADRVKFLAVPTAIGVVALREKLRLVIIVGSALWYRSKIAVLHSIFHIKHPTVPQSRLSKLRAIGIGTFDRELHHVFLCPMEMEIVTSCSYVVPHSGEHSH